MSEALKSDLVNKIDPNRIQMCSKLPGLHFDTLYSVVAVQTFEKNRFTGFFYFFDRERAPLGKIA